MKTLKITSALFLSLVLLIPQKSFSWGVWGHQHINRAAIFSLPEPLRSFYFNHNDFITIHASVPDLRKYELGFKKESPRHYFDVEPYGDSAFSKIPQTWDAAVKKYGKEMLYKNGILPWYIQLVMQKLTKAFKEQNKAEILLLSADLAHYVGDGYQPLHTTDNYDGQLSGQQGIHALFESQLPEFFGCHYYLKTRQAAYLKDVPETSWDIVKESHSEVKKVLTTEKKLLQSWGKKEIYVYDQSGKIRKNRYNKIYYSKAFCKAYEDKLNGLIAKQLRKSIYTTASLWYTAWVNAGKPDLSNLDDPYTTKINRKPLRTEYKEWSKEGKLMGIRSVPEFKK